MLIYAIQDEYLAKAEYKLIMSEYGKQSPFNNIIGVKEYHIELIKTLFEKYNIAIPEDNSNEYIVLPEDIKATLKTSINGGVNNIEIYEKFLIEDIPTDIAKAFEELIRGSENYLKTFKLVIERNDGR